MGSCCDVWCGVVCEYIGECASCGFFCCRNNSTLFMLGPLGPLFLLYAWVGTAPLLAGYYLSLRSLDPRPMQGEMESQKGACGGAREIERV